MKSTINPTSISPATPHPDIAAPAEIAASQQPAHATTRRHGYILGPDDLDRTMTMVAVAIVALTLLATTLGLAFALFVG